MKIAVTGGTGFLGRHLIDALYDDPYLFGSTVPNEIISIERPSEHNHVADDVITVLYHDIRAEFSDWLVNQLQGVDYVIHAGSFVQAIKSLEDPELCVQTNVVGTYNMLELARKIKPKRFLQVSSGETYGPAPEGVYFSEGARLNPSTPYSASKASAEMLCNAYCRSFGVPVVTISSMNLFGIRESRETYVPASIDKILRDEPVTVHVGPDGESGVRQWLNVEEFIDAIFFVLQNGEIGQKYNVVGEERTNHQIIEAIGKALNKTPKVVEVDVSLQHPAHDLRYAVNQDKIRMLGWVPWREENRYWECDNAFHWVVKTLAGLANG